MFLSMIFITSHIIQEGVITDISTSSGHTINGVSLYITSGAFAAGGVQLYT